MTAIITIIVVVEVLLLGTVFVLLHRTRKKQKISFQETLDLTDLPIITFYNNGKKLNFILDTGATNSIIHEGNLTECIYEETGDRRQLMGIDGNNHQVVMVEMPLIYRAHQYKETFQVQNMSKVFEAMRATTGVTVHGIIGNMFFTKYKYIIDFDELAAYTH